MIPLPIYICKPYAPPQRCPTQRPITTITQTPGAGHQGRQFAGQVRDIAAPEIPLLWQVHLPVGRNVGHQHGQAEAHGLQQGDGQPLVIGREHKQPGMGKHLVEGISRDIPGVDHLRDGRHPGLELPDDLFHDSN